ncbi:type I-E CRISPR-associated protein Cas5/CasD [Pseudogulbenkiania sp. NH8B]|uniref:type I-E CRISPR-associated protein Cas5/CasD n=1 Tax=Pseudogulbenkiania sp. (strain NH8B) TaxID=748280 RepID=UPI0018E08182|nr:type I-E CRISPR-associated protein Cas5/CasD [Pseudogulbenkiania sp. NH8B]
MMRDYLVFRLYGAMVSWGEVAVGEQRASASYPSRSALLGLLGAALGVRRDDEAGQARLSRGYRFGVKQVSGGSLLRDYHTVQQVDKPKPGPKVSYRTRREEVTRAELGTLLSSREYRCDSLAVVAVEALPDAPYTLAQLAHALQHPHFPLYLGRKSCPLGLPLAPLQRQAATLKAALDQWVGEHERVLIDDEKEYRCYRLPPDGGPARYYWDARLDAEAGMDASFTVVRLDQPTSRRRWQFAPRSENVHLDGGEA